MFERTVRKPPLCPAELRGQEGDSPQSSEISENSGAIAAQPTSPPSLTNDPSIPQVEAPEQPNARSANPWPESKLAREAFIAGLEKENAIGAYGTPEERITAVRAVLGLPPREAEVRS